MATPPTDYRANESDHNPDSRGVVRARDFTHDPRHGADMNELAETLREGRDRRISYVIWNRRIFVANSWRWQPYFGINPHDKHLHLSVVSGPAGDDASEWEIGMGALDEIVDGSTTLRAAIITMLGRSDADVNQERFLARKERAAIVTAITSLGGRLEAKLIALERDDASPIDAATRAQLVAEFRAAADQAVNAIDVPTADEIAQATINKIAD